MKSRRTLESVADQTSEMWENGSTSPQIVDLIAKEVGNIACEAPMREQAAGMYGVDAFHPFNLANHENKYRISYADVRCVLCPLAIEHTIEEYRYSIGRLRNEEDGARQIIEARKTAFSKVFWNSEIYKQNLIA